MEVTTLTPDRAAAYDEFVRSRPSGLFYYSFKFKEFVRALLGCGAEYLLAEEGGRIRGVLPMMYHERGGGRVYNSLPYFGSHGGILADGAEAYEALAAAYGKAALASGTLSSTVIANPLEGGRVTGIPGNHTDSRIGQLTSLAFQSDPVEEILARSDSSTRRNVRKAEREGVTVQLDPGCLEELGRIHRDNMQAIGGTAKNESFFRQVPAFFEPGKDFDLYVARREGAMVAGLLVFYFNRVVEYYTPAIVEEYRPLQPLSLIVIQAMAEAASKDFTWWNWGGTRPGQTGVYRFKKKWGAVERAYTYTTQLNDMSLLTWDVHRLLEAYPSFYVFPFSAARPGPGSEHRH
ncbi:MAG: peptidoglycan bridge formation glycyltransferase FemA/FemB family protein [Planctomycetes bacterium]|nr:peptidoglycan bridge formation glycyltransferase FemA/FemB family protein [Planctomycetota bacterium]